MTNENSIYVDSSVRYYHLPQSVSLR